jgi:hypothetical protein
MANKVGRPTKYDPIFIDKVDEYLLTTGKEQMHLPKVESFAIFIGVHKDTLYEWAKYNIEFSDSLRKIMERQAEQLIDDGIYGGKEVNSTIVKLLLMNNHNMREKKDTDLTTDGQSINPILVKFIDKEEDGNSDTN